MSTIQTAIRELQQEHEAILAKAGDIERAIDALQRLDREGLTPSRPSGVSVVAPATRRRAAAAPRPAKARKAATSTDGLEANILAALTRAGEAVTPAALAKAMTVSLHTLRRYLKPLIKRRLVVVSGNTSQRRVSLPDRPAKEGL